VQVADIFRYSLFGLTLYYEQELPIPLGLLGRGPYARRRGYVLLELTEESTTMRRWIAGAVLFLGGALPNAHASLILSSLAPSTGNGIGAATTILTVQSPGNSTAEAGCVGAAIPGGMQTINANCGTPVGTSSFTFGQTQTGQSQTGLRALPTGITNASQIGIVFNPAQPAGTSITLQELNAQFYNVVNGQYTLIDDAVYTGPTNLMQTLQGIGNAGWVFTLDATEQALLNDAINSGASIVVGASLEAGCGDNGFAACGANNFGAAVGGHDVVQIGAISSSESNQVPEPASLTMIGGGLLAIAGMYRRCAKSRV